MKSKSSGPSFAALVQDFFCQRLVNQQNASPQTVAAYRDTFRVLFQYLAEHRKKQPTALTLADLDVPVVLSFLDYLEKKRHNSIRTRNARFAAMRSFLKYAAARDPAALLVVQRVLAIPMKRFERPQVGYLTREEIEIILEAPDRSTWSGLRDRTLFMLLYNTGARVSEAIGLRIADVSLGSSATARILGKGRKERTVPLWKSTATQLKEWQGHICQEPDKPLFPNARGGPLSRSGVESRLQEAVRVAAESCASLKKKHISPHTMRHTTAVHLLQSGVDITVVALWLGHESPATTHQYVEANLAMKEEALSKIPEVSHRPLRYRAPDNLLQFLEGL